MRGTGVGIGGKYDVLREAVIFAKCLGLNDIKAQRGQKADPDTGETEVIECLGMTTTRDGALEKAPDLSTVITHTAPITSLSAQSRFFYQDAVNTIEWDGVGPTTGFPLVVGPVAHSPIDARINNGVTVYKSKNSAPSSGIASVGVDPDPQISKRYYQMPVFQEAFVYNAKMYAVNAADPRFLQYSKDYHYDLWNLGDDFLASQEPIRQARHVYSQKPEANGCIVLLHDESVTVYDGTGPHDFSNNSYICTPLIGSLCSGWISKVLGYGHIFLCRDGVYMVDADGVLTNMTVGQTSFLDALNTSYYGAVVKDGKYLAFGNNVCLEYDFITKSLLKRSPEGVISAASFNDECYFAKGSLVTKYSTAPGTGSSMVQFPYSNLGVDRAKSVSDLFLTGNLVGDLVITATGDNGVTWEKEVSGEGPLYNQKIKVPRTVLGNHVSFTLQSPSGEFRLEKLRATYVESNRSK